MGDYQSAVRCLLAGRKCVTRSRAVHRIAGDAVGFVSVSKPRGAWISGNSRNPVLSAQPLHDRESRGTACLTVLQALPSRANNSATASPIGFDIAPGR